MARSVPKCKRAAYVYDRDFIVVDDISGVLKMRSECAIDGYGFLSSQGDIRNPQETPPIIREQMAAWPDPRPIGQPIFTPEPDYQYFIFNYTIFDVANPSTSFDATTSISFDAPISSIVWSVDGVYSATGLVVVLLMDDGLHDIQAVLTDTNGNTATFIFEYTHPHVPIMTTVVDYEFIGANYATTTTDSTGNTTTTLGITDGTRYAYILSNRLQRLNKEVVIDNGGALSPFLTFENDFEITLATKFTDPVSFAGSVFKFYNGGGSYFSLAIFLDGHFEFIVAGYSGFSFSGTGVNTSVEQVFTLKRTSGLLELLIDGVSRGSITNSNTMIGGRFVLPFNNIGCYVDYLRIEKLI